MQDAVELSQRTAKWSCIELFSASTVLRDDGANWLEVDVRHDPTGSIIFKIHLGGLASSCNGVIDTMMLDALTVISS
jgi:hypothetical protein